MGGRGRGAFAQRYLSTVAGRPIILMLGASTSGIKFCLYKHLRFCLFSGARPLAAPDSCG